MLRKIAGQNISKSMKIEGVLEGYQPGGVAHLDLFHLGGQAALAQVQGHQWPCRT